MGKRQHRRVPATEPVELIFRGDATRVAGCLVNLSQGGAYVRCATPVEVGRDLVCAFELRGSEAPALIKARGRVQWVATSEVRGRLGPGFGLTFVKPKPELTALLRTALAQAGGS